ncbi:MAG: RdgB/HAM1 family non-canonical purine NTP pyrophosphatase [Acutalibacteraceae bacterium]|nr:RdgB/HAM1 family non-canonical purine NTP pyrophosphatase [Clostridia bacterium]MEE3450274.1 RdgB/HAM1 family non-canonical purine NTP pyrophosphatase [Acutalibacteraceae bacterium]
MKKFIIASNNKAKVKELDRILNPLGITAVTAASEGIDLGDVEETGKTFAENAYIKALAAYKKTGMPSVADDSGLMVDALNGEPGVYSARYADTDKQRIEKLLFNLKGIPTQERSAHFVSSVCCIIDENTVITAEGKCSGIITEEPHGQGGFGYDPVFMTDSGKTFAELTAEEKDRISHRGRALRELYDKLSKTEF